jgi:PIN domain nuclease of toxin-antitoxin system
MNLLLDTHIVLWASADRSNLPKEAIPLLDNGANSLWVSAVTFWEVAIKRSLNKPDFRIDVAPLRAGLLRSGHFELSVDGTHAVELAKLPMYHTDPFDRLLVAQAKAEGMILITSDRHLSQYGENILVVERGR